MRHTHFEIKQFKGINHIRLDLDATPRANVYTLVGLNESGKTTVLEALNSSGNQIESLSPLALPGLADYDPYELIPMNRRANFNGVISIEVGYEMDEADLRTLNGILAKEAGFEITDPIGRFTVTKSFNFEDSIVEKERGSSTWSTTPLIGRLRAEGKRGKGRLTTVHHYGATRELWQKIVATISRLLPPVLYFPNFLFEFPDRIYLEDKSGATDNQKHQFYRLVLQDVLDSIGDKTNLERHVLARAKSGTKHDRNNLEAVLLRMEENITRTVFGNWNKIFKRNVGNKRIVVGWDQDEEDQRWYINLRVKDGSEVYQISERSLGFRWFFAFLLFTQYRGFRNNASGKVLFLLDEPASNLHPSAQSQLLGSFKNLGNCSIIYTTHSHHMVNPEWLETTYVVKNEGLDYMSEDDYVANQTLVTLQKYRNFAVKHPNQTTYFQPVLDVLDYKIGRLENVPDVVMVEGKNDFYTLMFVQERIVQPEELVRLMPGTGSGSLDTVIRLYLGWGRNFIVLLDSDKSGKEQRQRYETVFGQLLKGRVYTLADVNPSWAKTEMEALFTLDEQLALQKEAYPDAAKFNKTHFNRAIQELYLADRTVPMSQDTIDRFAAVFAFCRTQLASRSEV